MASTTNPETGNRKPTPSINLKNSIPSFCYSKFNPQTQVAEKSSVFSNFHGRKFNHSNFIHFNHDIPMIFDADADNNDTATTFPGFIIPSFLVFDGNGSSAASLVRRFSGSVNTPLFRKLADLEPGSGSDVLSQMEMMTIHGDSGDSGGSGIAGRRGSGNCDGNGSGNGGNGEGVGDGNDGNGDAAAPAAADDGENNQWWKLWVERVKVHGLALYTDGSTHYSPVIGSDTFAFQYNSWQEIGKAMLQLWLERNNYNLDPIPEIPDGNPNFCCPGSVTLFGRFEGDVFYDFWWQVHEWDAVKLLIRDIIVIRLVEGIWKEGN